MKQLNRFLQVVKDVCKVQWTPSSGAVHIVRTHKGGGFSNACRVLIALAVFSNNLRLRGGGVKRAKT